MKKKLGIIGGGQLGMMMAEAAQKLKISTIVLDPTPQSPAGQITDQIVGDFKDPTEIEKLASDAEFVTFEIESANAKALKNLELQNVQVNPSSKSLEIIQDKFLQKHFLMANSLPCVDFTRVATKEDILRAAEYLGYPAVLKARFYAYDGRGNAVIKSQKDVAPALEKLKNTELYIEEFIPFEKELAVQIVRDTKGNIKTYPLVVTIQKNNICDVVKYPAEVSKEIETEAIKIADKTVSVLYGAGVFGVEMFLTKDGKVLVNEIAPRVHNSGHWTIEGCNTSQFENHVRAVCSLPLGSTSPKVKSAVMINILGERDGKAQLTGLEKIEKKPNTYVHIYGKHNTKIERKMGHITVTGSNLETVYKEAMVARKLISI